MKQVDKSHYNIDNYCDASRFVSYYHQLKSVLDLKPESILEIGVGDMVFGNYIKFNTTIKYESLDIAEDLNPDILGSVEKIPCEDDSYDTIICAEVLEHLPFEKFSKSIGEINRVTKKYAIISLPHFGPPLKFSIKVPFIKEIKFAKKIHYPIEHKFKGEHYSEIGKRGYPLKRIKSEIQKKFKILKDFVPFENQYHHFFILEKK